MHTILKFVGRLSVGLAGDAKPVNLMLIILLDREIEFYRVKLGLLVQQNGKNYTEGLERAARSLCRRGLSGSEIRIADVEEDGVGGERDGSGDCEAGDDGTESDRWAGTDEFEGSWTPSWPGSMTSTNSTTRAIRDQRLCRVNCSDSM